MVYCHEIATSLILLDPVHMRTSCVDLTKHSHCSKASSLKDCNGVHYVFSSHQATIQGWFAVLFSARDAISPGMHLHWPHGYTVFLKPESPLQPLQAYPSPQYSSVMSDLEPYMGRVVR